MNTVLVSCFSGVRLHALHSEASRGHEEVAGTQKLKKCWKSIQLQKQKEKRPNPTFKRVK